MERTIPWGGSHDGGEEAAGRGAVAWEKTGRGAVEREMVWKRSIL